MTYSMECICSKIIFKVLCFKHLHWAHLYLSLPSTRRSRHHLHQQITYIWIMYWEVTQIIFLCVTHSICSFWDAVTDLFQKSQNCDLLVLILLDNSLEVGLVTCFQTYGLEVVQIQAEQTFFLFWPSKCCSLTWTEPFLESNSFVGSHCNLNRQIGEVVRHI